MSRLRAGYRPKFLGEKDNDRGQHDTDAEYNHPGPFVVPRINTAADGRAHQHAGHIAKRQGGADQAAGPALRLQENTRADTGLHVRHEEVPSEQKARAKLTLPNEHSWCRHSCCGNLSRPSLMPSSELFGESRALRR